MARTFIRYLLLINICFFTLACQDVCASYYPRAESVPGGIAKVLLKHHGSQPPVAFYQKRRVSVVRIQDDKTWVAMVGIPLNQQLGQQKLIVKQPNYQEIFFTIKHKQYPEQRLTIRNKRKVNPLASDKLRIKREQKKQQKLLKIWRDGDPFRQYFSLPVRGRISSHFGLRRVYNGQARAPHSGLDIAASAGTKVKATIGGIVIATGDFYYTGHTVLLDHGQGLITLYAHLRDILVTSGQRLKKGAVLGTVGQTGRATGPHLHWTVYLNQVPVNPLLFVKRSQPRHSAVKLAKSLEIVHWQPLPGTVSLTFDDGPSPIYTPQVLAILKRYGIKATFFVMGSLAKKYPKLLHDIVADGHAVAIHTMTHPKLTKLSNKRLYFEVVKAKEIVANIIGKSPVCLRPPFGLANKRVRHFVHAHNMILVPMGFNSFDYKNKGVLRLKQWVVANARSGRVFLLHDGYKNRAQTVKALPGIIEGIRKKGLGFSAICYP